MSVAANLEVSAHGSEINYLYACLFFLDYEYLPNQYIGNITDYQTNTTSMVIQTLSCPSDVVAIAQCQYNISYGCPSYEQTLTCIQSELPNLMQL